MNRTLSIFLSLICLILLISAAQIKDEKCPQVNEIEIAQFTGTESENKLTIKFKDKPPVVGAATEWTDKKWYFEKAVASCRFLFSQCRVIQCLESRRSICQCRLPRQARRT